MTTCTRIGIQRFLEAAEESKKDNISSKIESLKQLSYKVEMHKSGGGCEFCNPAVRNARMVSRGIALDFGDEPREACRGHEFESGRLRDEDGRVGLRCLTFWESTRINGF